MRRFLLFIGVVTFLFSLCAKVEAQTQTVTNGGATSAVNFPNTGCLYNWINDTPGIGLAASGTGNIPSFTAVNNGSSPVVATITVTPEQVDYAYIANYGSSSISVINTATNTVVSVIPVGAQPGGVSASPDGSRVYVIIESTTSVAVINTATNAVIATIPVGSDPGADPENLKVSPDGKEVYVVNLHDETISVISTATNTVIATISSGFIQPYCLAFIPNSNLLYVSSSPDQIFVINTQTSAVINQISAGAEPIAIVTSPDGSQAFVTCQMANAVSVINTATSTVVATIPVGNAPYGAAISPDGSFLYVGCRNDGTVMVIDTKTDKVIKTINVGYNPDGISVTADGKEVYVTSNGSPGSVVVISGVTNSVIATVPVGLYPYSIGNFIVAGAPCTGTPFTFTITVNPTPATIPTIVNSTAAGNISACTGTASASPNIQQFTVFGSDLSANIVVAAPINFEVSIAQGSGYGSNVTLTPIVGTVNSTVIYVRSAASAPSGGISGKVLLTSTGATSQNVAVTGSVSAPVNPSVSIAASSSSICAGTPVTFTATPVNGGGAPAYQWLLNGNNVGTNSATFGSNTIANGDMISCVMISNAACATPANVTSNNIIMNVNPQTIPSINIAISSYTICSGSPLTFTATPTGGGSAPVYQWMVNGAGTGTNNPSFTSSTLANGDMISCVMTSNAKCAAPANATSNTITVNINPLPVVNAGGGKTVKDGSSIVLNASTTGNVADITWSPASGLSNNKILDPVASPSSTTTYTLTVQTMAGCLGTDTVTVHVLPQNIDIPNTFTPNGDGINDTWDIKYLNAYLNCSVEIFSRWGFMVYSSIGYGVPWDGTYKGAMLPSGTYYYIINLKNGLTPLSGFVAIIR